MHARLDLAAGQPWRQWLVEPECHNPRPLDEAVARPQPAAVDRHRNHREPKRPVQAGEAWLERRWHELGGDDGHRDAGIVVEGRRIPVRARSKGMAWFDFADLCEGPRAAADYIEVAREFHTVLVGGIPVMDARNDDAARRFVTLVDELYDRNVNLVCSADAPPTALYAGERLAGAFERTASRLVEMRSDEYLAREHRG